MPWARVDDELFHHPKVRRAWRCRPALGLHLMALSYCMKHGTEGLIHSEFVEDQLPDPGERSNVTAALVDCGLWEQDASDWRIHDFLRFNPSNQQIAERRDADAKRKASSRG